MMKEVGSICFTQAALYELEYSFFERNFVDFRKTERVLIWTFQVPRNSGNFFSFFKTKLNPHRTIRSRIEPQALL